MGDQIAAMFAKQHGLDLEDAAFVLELSAAFGSDEDFVSLAAAGTLDWSPKKNWVDKVGGLPRGIRDMAIHMMQNSGLTREHAIAASVERAKQLAAMGKARWVKEVAKWEAMKAKSHAMTAAKKAT